MPTFTATVNVTLKKSILDPQGQTILQALEALGFRDAKDLRVGKHFILKVDSGSKVEAEKQVKNMCEKLLINPVIEEYHLEVKESGGTSK